MEDVTSATYRLRHCGRHVRGEEVIIIPKDLSFCFPELDDVNGLSALARESRLYVGFYYTRSFATVASPDGKTRLISHQQLTKDLKFPEKIEYEAGLR